MFSKIFITTLLAVSIQAKHAVDTPGATTVSEVPVDATPLPEETSSSTVSEVSACTDYGCAESQGYNEATSSGYASTHVVATSSEDTSTESTQGWYSSLVATASVSNGDSLAAQTTSISASTTSNGSVVAASSSVTDSISSYSNKTYTNEGNSTAIEFSGSGSSSGNSATYGSMSDDLTTSHHKSASKSKSSDAGASGNVKASGLLFAIMVGLSMI